MTTPLLATDVPADSPATPPDNHAGGTATVTRPRPAKPPVEHLPPFRVLLHNDDVSDMVFVVRSIVELTPLNQERAVQVMLEAHKTGVGLLLVTHKERAELYQDQFQSKKLTVTIEPAE
jgi:ATP-dependent Clp protease adaptor protein ClpS